MSLVAPIDSQMDQTISDRQQVNTLKQNLLTAEELAGREKAEKYWEVAEGFEEVFLSLMMRAMRKTTMESGFLGSGNDAKIYQSMYDQEIASSMAERREFGISRMIFDWLTRNEPNVRNQGLSAGEVTSRYRQVNSIAPISSEMLSPVMSTR